MLVLTLAFCVASQALKDREYSKSLDKPRTLNVVGLCTYADDSLWVGGTQTLRLTPEGKVMESLKIGGSSIAPEGKSCWIAQAHGDQQIHRWNGKTWQSFRLGANPAVCRCRNSSDILAVAGQAIWSLGPHSARRIKGSHVGEGESLVDALSSSAFAVCSSGLDNFVSVTVSDGVKLSTLKVPGALGSAVLRASRDIAFVLVQPKVSMSKLILYKIEVPSKRFLAIANIQGDYKESLAWDKSSDSVLVNASDGTGSRIECLSIDGTLRWKSTRLDEAVTGIAASPKGGIFCSTKAGPIYLFGRS